MEKRTLLFFLVTVSIMDLAASLLNMTAPFQVSGVWKGTVLLPCTYEPSADYEQTEVTWTIRKGTQSSVVIRKNSGGERISLAQYRGRVTVQSGVSGDVTLTIKSLQVTERGYYTCEVKWNSKASGYKVVRSATIHLDVIKAEVTQPVISPNVSTITLPLGGSLDLHCSTTGTPPFRYRWYKLNSSGGKILKVYKSHFSISSVQYSDQAPYYCEVENSVSKTVVKESNLIQINVVDPSELITTTTEPETTTVPFYELTTYNAPSSMTITAPFQIEGIWKKSVTLPCTYQPSSEYLQEEVTWSFRDNSSTSIIIQKNAAGDHIPLSQYRGRVSVLSPRPGVVSLNIRNLNVTDRGQYICKVTWISRINRFQMSRFATILLDIDKAEVTKPVITPEERHINLPIGGFLRFTCLASGFPPIKYRWYKLTSTGDKIVIVYSSKFTIQSARPLDQGLYFCEVENFSYQRVTEQSDFIQLSIGGEHWWW
nr:PREDICTED: basement membrane-specific heparan sulfate proteoglycan core protein-like [Latimeria chalumnae]|eukprot:XP_014340963.1 PREDICTED: basement membrane-specific heparan sulfate proteoglycan core protein-like [Latimeria chalumnae]